MLQKSVCLFIVEEIGLPKHLLKKKKKKKGPPMHYIFLLNGCDSVLAVIYEKSYSTLNPFLFS